MSMADPRKWTMQRCNCALRHLVTVTQHVPLSRRRSCTAPGPSCGAVPLLLQSVRRAPGVWELIQDATRVPSAPAPPVMSHDPAASTNNVQDSNLATNNSNKCL